MISRTTNIRAVASKYLIPNIVCKIWLQKQNCRREIHLTCTTKFADRFGGEASKKQEEKELQTIQNIFENAKNKNRDSYLDMIHIFINRDSIYRRGHVEFIYSALKNMEQFGVNKDLEVYKALIEVLPKGKFIPTNMFQVEFMHYPKQQQCIIDLLEQMEDNGVMPDYEMEDILKSIFGSRAHPLRKYWRMMYWMPKFKHLSPWPVPDPLPSGIFELAELAIKRITSVDIQTQITVYQASEIEDSIDDTWIISGQSPTQKELLAKHDIQKPIYVEGNFKVWLKGVPVNYFILRTEPKPLNADYEDLDDVSDIQVSSFFDFRPPVKKHLKVVPSVHEQEDGVIYAVCATGTSSKDSLLSWIRHLEKDNPVLAKVSVVFTLKTGSREVSTLDSGSDKDKKSEVSPVDSDSRDSSRKNDEN